MEKINLTCINCPLGCPVQVTMASWTTVSFR